MTKTLINICGSERSGSTMLDLILGNDPKAFSCGEVYALFRPWRTHHFTPECRCKENCEYLEAFKKVREDRFHRLLFESFGFDWVVDSSKDLCWVVDNQKWAIRDNRRVLNLVTWKQPTSFVVSYLKRGWNSDIWRTVFMNYYKNFLDTRLPFTALCHDEFVQDPQPYLRLLCDLLGMEYFEGKMNFWEKKHHQVFGSGGTAQQVNTGTSHIFRSDEESSKFAAEIEAVRRTLADDGEINGIIKRLRQHDISSQQFEPESAFNLSLLGRKTFWYYSHKLRLKAKRFMPEPFP